MWEGGKLEPETDPRRRPTPPDGQGPLLEWFRCSRRSNRRTTGYAFGIVFITMTLAAWGFWWMAKWSLWLIVLFAPVMVFLTGRSQWVAAGADWFASDTGWV